jgi:heparan-alpha-glucosaminide N-acetyltransferase
MSKSSEQLNILTAGTSEIRAATQGKLPTQMPSGRMVSLDAFRGFVMMVLISNGFGFPALAGNPTWGVARPQFDHTPWEGMTLWDLIQPAFIRRLCSKSTTQRPVQRQDREGRV